MNLKSRNKRLFGTFIPPTDTYGWNSPYTSKEVGINVSCPPCLSHTPTHSQAAAVTVCATAATRAGNTGNAFTSMYSPVLGWFLWSDMTMKDETAVIYDEMDLEHFFFSISRRCKIGACISYSLMAFTAFQPEGAPRSSPLISPYKPYIYCIYIFLWNSTIFKVRMCLPESKRAKSTLPLECIRDSSMLTALKTSPQLFLPTIPRGERVLIK